ncbi:hypothetical protein [Aureispira anguillae]|uniref:Multipass membrane protein n=1 Tax=Aureispira anguillae TaxID=2864201 RepID=A0A915YEE3_9BACT|nr:hypothetical protein [Aureispira anguillae]BDS11579.1 hypothetical protein AsAng_0022930 [Aureispira anguillae]
MKNRHPLLLILSLLTAFPTLSFAQHGSGGAGAMGVFVIVIIVWLAIVAILSLIVLILNVRAYHNKTGTKTRIAGIVLSVILFALFLLAVVSDFVPAILGLILSIGSILHLSYKERIVYKNEHDNILDDANDY